MSKWTARIGPIDLSAIASEADNRWSDTDDALSALQGPPIATRLMTDALLAKLLALAVSDLVFEREYLRSMLDRATWERGVMLHAIESDIEADPWIKRNTVAAKIVTWYRTIWPKK